MSEDKLVVELEELLDSILSAWLKLDQATTELKQARIEYGKVSREIDPNSTFTIQEALAYNQEYEKVESLAYEWRNRVWCAKEQFLELLWQFRNSKVPYNVWVTHNGHKFIHRYYDEWARDAIEFVVTGPDVTFTHVADEKYNL